MILRKKLEHQHSPMQQWVIWPLYTGNKTTGSCQLMQGETQKGQLLRPGLSCPTKDNRLSFEHSLHIWDKIVIWFEGGLQGAIYVKWANRTLSRLYVVQIGKQLSTDSKLSQEGHLTHETKMTHFYVSLSVNKPINDWDVKKTFEQEPKHLQETIMGCLLFKQDL